MNLTLKLSLVLVTYLSLISVGCNSVKDTNSGAAGTKLSLNRLAATGETSRTGSGNSNSTAGTNQQSNDLLNTLSDILYLDQTQLFAALYSPTGCGYPSCWYSSSIMKPDPQTGFRFNLPSSPEAFAEVYLAIKIKDTSVQTNYFTYQPDQTFRQLSRLGIEPVTYTTSVGQAGTFFDDAPVYQRQARGIAYAPVGALGAMNIRGIQPDGRLMPATADNAHLILFIGKFGNLSQAQLNSANWFANGRAMNMFPLVPNVLTTNVKFRQQNPAHLATDQAIYLSSPISVSVRNN